MIKNIINLFKKSPIYDNNNLYVHVGAHKTGTTYIQRILNDNSELLLKKGIEYPAYGKEFDKTAHHIIAWFLSDSKNYNVSAGRFSADNLEIFRDNIVNSLKLRDVILSSEEFSRIAAYSSDFKKIKEFFSNFEKIKIILFLRNQFKTACPLWQEEIRSKRDMSFETFCNNFFRDGGYADYYNQIKNWESLVGKKNISIFIYDNIIDEKKDVAHEFFKNIGRDKIFPQLKIKDKRANESMDKNTLSLLFRLNLIEKEFKNTKTPYGFYDKFRNFMNNRKNREIEAIMERLPKDSFYFKNYFSFVKEVNGKIFTEYQKQIVNLRGDELFGIDKSYSVDLISGQVLDKNLDMYCLYEEILNC